MVLTLYSMGCSHGLRWFRHDPLRVRYQHGDNPEHSLLVNSYAINDPTPWLPVRQKVKEWLEVICEDVSAEQ